MAPWEFTNKQLIEQEKASPITEVSNFHTALKEIHKNTSENNTLMRKEAQNIRNARTNVLTFTLGTTP